MNNNELITPRELAALWHVHPKTLAKWARQGKITMIRTPGGSRRYIRAEFDAIQAKALDDA